MSLPKVNVPVYEAILPSTGTVIKYRPFLVKEEKILLTAMEAEDEKVISDAVNQIIKNCVQGNIKVNELPTFDIEYLFLRLRAKSVGEKVTLGMRPWGCPQNNGELCELTTEVEIDLEKVIVVKDEKHSSKIMIDDNIGIMMSYPDLSLITKMEKETGIQQTETGMQVIKSCIQMIFTEEETHEKGSFTEKELDEFIDSLNTEQFSKIKTFFDTMPVLKYTAKYTCSTCGEEKETTVQGLNSFFG